MGKTKITCLFLDIGGVLLSNGWGHEFRKLVADHFQLNYKNLDDRHKLNMVSYEEGKITLSEYLNRVVFYEKQSFTPNQFQDLMFSQTTPNLDMIDLIRRLKDQYKLKIVVVNNEGKELNEYRIKKFKLNEFVDFFISSCYVHFRKPDVEIYRLALNMVQVSIEQILYIDDIQMFVDASSTMGIRSLQHKNYNSTYNEFVSLGLK